MIWPTLESERELAAGPNEPSGAELAELAELKEVAELAALTELWTRVLDELETQLLLEDPAAPHWAPPYDLAPMPESLRARAGVLARAQILTITELHDSLAAASAELATLVPVRQTTKSVYLDVLG
ncbi:hypothetical protein [Arthrobacter glacialis]|uniref:hypothetical protein n=1 Tax=Arthrobacter glacialis TaxID=1664 RepID=UPI000CD40FA0|nr:hypothetical protein [Arthrobacter glacialis]POH59394.1 hypothetical protein CVS28_07955 [Arthrobacter glacialis]